METPPKLPTQVQQIFAQQQRKKVNKKKWIIGIVIGVIVIAFASQSNKGTNTNKSDDTLTKPLLSTNKSEFQDYLSKSKITNEALDEGKILIRQKVLDEFKVNPMYTALVVKKIIDQKYLKVLQAAGHSMISEQKNLFEIEVPIENQLKAFPGGLRFVINIIQLDMYGGIPKEFLDVYDRYTNQFRISGIKGTTLYSTDGKPNVVIKETFTLVEALTIFHYHYPEILDDFYNAHANGLITWQGKKGDNYRYAFLSSKGAFNNYMGSTYPDSKNYIHYDLSVTAPELYAEYDANEVSADEKFKDKSIAVSGTVTKIARDIMDNPYVILNAGEFEEVQCTFKDTEALKSLVKGDHVIIIGTCTGKMAMIVGLSDSKIF